MKLGPIIKLALSAVMLGVILRSVRIDQLISTISQISLGWALVVIFGYSFGQFFSSIKWWLLVRAGGINAPLVGTLRAYWIGMFVNCFGLGTVGGDLARALLLSDSHGRKAEALASVVADRLHGLAVLSVIALISTATFGTHSLPGWLVSLLIFLALGIVSGWFLGPLIIRAVLPVENRFRQKVLAISDTFPRKFDVLFRISAISVAFHLLQITLHSVMAKAVGADIPFHLLLVVIPFVNIVSTLPISWNGLGVRENAYKFFLVPALLSPEQAVTFGALWLSAVTVASAIGGLVAVITGDLSKLKSSKAESANIAQ